MFQIYIIRFVVGDFFENFFLQKFFHTDVTERQQKKNKQKEKQTKKAN